MKLKAKVAAVNRANHTANILQSKLRMAFVDLIGQKVVKANNEVLNKIKLPDLPRTAETNVWQHLNPYNLSWMIRVSETLPGCVAYYETHVVVGKLEDGILTEIFESQDLRRTDFTEEEVQTKRKTLEIARKALSQAQAELHPFPEFDWQN